MERGSAILAAALYFLLCAGAANINIMPRNLTVQEGQYATFTCEVPCSHSAYWYIGDFHNSAPLPYVDSVPGITYTRSVIGVCASTSSPGNYTDRITILATADLDRIAVQCSASMIDCDPSDASCGALTYSRFRTLRVERRPDPSTPSPTPAAGGDTTVCPSPSRVVETTTSTVTDTVTETEIIVSTVTATVENTVVIKETPLCPADPSTSGTPMSGTSSILQSVGLSSAVVVTAVIVGLSVLLRL